MLYQPAQRNESSNVLLHDTARILARNPDNSNTSSFLSLCGPGLSSIFDALVNHKTPLISTQIDSLTNSSYVESLRSSLVLVSSINGNGVQTNTNNKNNNDDYIYNENELENMENEENDGIHIDTADKLKSNLDYDDKSIRDVINSSNTDFLAILRHPYHLAILEYIISSGGGKHCDLLFFLALRELDIPTLLKNCNLSYSDIDHVSYLKFSEQFVSDLCERLFIIAINAQHLSNPIYNLIWSWINDIYSSLLYFNKTISNINPTDDLNQEQIKTLTQFQLNLRVFTSLITSCLDCPTDFYSTDISLTKNLLKNTIDDTFLSIIHKYFLIIESKGNIPKSDTLLTPVDFSKLIFNFTLSTLESFFKIIPETIDDSKVNLNGDNNSETWNILPFADSKTLNDLDVDTLNSIRDIVDICLKIYKYQHDNLNENHTLNNDILYGTPSTFVIQSIVLGSILLKNRSNDILKFLLDIIIDKSSDTFDFDIYVIALESLSILAHSGIDLRGLIVEHISHFLSTPSPCFYPKSGFNSSQHNALRHCASSILLHNLKYVKSKETIKNVLYTFVHLIRNITPSSIGIQSDVIVNGATNKDNSAGTTDEMLRRNSISGGIASSINGVSIGNSLTDNIIVDNAIFNAISAISILAPVFSEKVVIEVVLQAFGGCLRNPKYQACYDLIWDSIANIALSCGNKVFDDILKFISEFSRRTFSGISRSMHIIARGVKSTEMSNLFLKRAFVLFTDQVLKVSLKDSVSGPFDQINSLSPDSALVQELFEIANDARLVCEQKHYRPRIQCSEKLLTLFRDFWFITVLGVMKQDGTWSPKWEKVLSAIALKTPVLTPSGSKGSIEAEIAANSILRVRKIGHFVANKTRNLLINMFPQHAMLIKNMSPDKCCYLVTIYATETLRLKKGHSNTILKYINDERLYNDDLYPILQSVGDKVLNTYHLRIKNSLSSKSKALENHASALLIESASRLIGVRHFAKKHMIYLFENCPHFVWNKVVTSRLLDLVQVLDQRFRKNPNRKAILHKKLGLNLDFLKHSDIEKTSEDFLELAKKWMRIALSRSLQQTSGLVQGYMLELYLNYPDLLLTHDSDLLCLIKMMFNDKEYGSSIISEVGRLALFYGEVLGMVEMIFELNNGLISKQVICTQLSKKFLYELDSLLDHSNSPDFISKLNPIIFRCSSLILISPNIEEELLQALCWLPVRSFTMEVMQLCTENYYWLMSSRPECVKRILSHSLAVWESVQRLHYGIYKGVHGYDNPFMSKMTYTPSEKPKSRHNIGAIHLIWLKFFLNRFKSDKLADKDILRLYTRIFLVACENIQSVKLGASVREAYFNLLLLGIKIALHLQSLGDPACFIVFQTTLNVTIKWFEIPIVFGDTDVRELNNIVDYLNLLLKFDTTLAEKMINHKQYILERLVWTPSNILDKNSNYSNRPSSSSIPLTSNASITNAIPSGKVTLTDALNLAALLLRSEISRLHAWINPLDDQVSPCGNLTSQSQLRAHNWDYIVNIAWCINPKVAVLLPARFISVTSSINNELSRLCALYTASVIYVPETILSLINILDKKETINQMRLLLYSSSVPPSTAITLLAQENKSNPWVLQYAVRTLEFFPVDSVFFYIPQMVQALRYDKDGYVEHFILMAGRTSQHFAHQIIWNMNANMYKFDKDGKADAPDLLKPTLDRVEEKIVSSLSGADKQFYEREFGFFKKVTSISGSLKPLVESGASKQAKKEKIDIEIAKISVDPGVYLPTNPDSIVVDIDYKSGRPLQSHAKAPFMATFAVCQSLDGEGAFPILNSINQIGSSIENRRWMSSIFKVGDDCRQDVLALQLISIFKHIFINSGMDLYVFPYRVVATAPGCGVIEVIPKSLSRDQMGREKVNSLFDWFIAEFGREDSVNYRKAQHEFIKSLAAYSVIMFLLQIKDRHNGNIMFDKEGHLLHIDFGFMLSIAPGGGLLEGAPFKLSAEMVQVLGGDAKAAPYKLFSQLCVKAYLATRQYADDIVRVVTLMMDSGLPCYKGEQTIRKLRERFQPDKTEKEATQFMLNCIKQSHLNTRSELYDKFQYLQNGIPY